MRSRFARWPVPVLMVLTAACGGEAAPAAPDPTSPVEVPATYVVIDPVPFSGDVEGGGSISFEVQETDTSTGETLAGGQVVVHVYEMMDLVVAVDVGDAGCEGGGPVTIALPGPHAIGAGGEVGVLGDGLRLEGTVHRTASGLLWLDLLVDGVSCAAGPLSWSADPTP